MPPSLYPRFAEEKQENAWETKTSMGTVAPVSPCFWLLLLGGLCLPFWPQVLLPPSLKHPATHFSRSFFHPVKWLQRCCRFILWPLTPSLWVVSSLGAEVVCHLHWTKSTLQIYLLLTVLGALLGFSSGAFAVTGHRCRPKKTRPYLTLIT